MFLENREPRNPYNLADSLSRGGRVESIGSVGGGLIAADRPTITGSLENQSGELTRLDELVGMLYSKLAPVLSIESHGGLAKEGERLEPTTVLEFITDNTRRIREVIKEVEDILSRLEV